jgi:hypothetical protein
LVSADFLGSFGFAQRKLAAVHRLAQGAALAQA